MAVGLWVEAFCRETPVCCEGVREGPERRFGGLEADGALCWAGCEGVQGRFVGLEGGEGCRGGELDVHVQRFGGIGEVCGGGGGSSGCAWVDFDAQCRRQGAVSFETRTFLVAGQWGHRRESLGLLDLSLGRYRLGRIAASLMAKPPTATCYRDRGRAGRLLGTCVWSVTGIGTRVTAQRLALSTCLLAWS